eukprot:scaffold6505_cov79-Isochrysis_galbana.AAC.2
MGRRSVVVSYDVPSRRACRGPRATRDTGRGQTWDTITQPMESHIVQVIKWGWRFKSCGGTQKRRRARSVDAPPLRVGTSRRIGRRALPSGAAEGQGIACHLTCRQGKRVKECELARLFSECAK